MRLGWVKWPRSRSQHATGGDRGGIRFGDAGEHRDNRARQLRFGTGATSIRVNGECRIC